MYKKIFPLLFILISLISWGQNTGTIYGKIRTDKGRGIDLFNIAIIGLPGGTTTDEKGNYKLTIPSDTNLTIVFSHIEYKTVQKKIQIKSGENLKVHIKAIQK